MNEGAIHRILEAVYHAIEDEGWRDEAAIAFFTFASMISYFEVGDGARDVIENIIRSLGSELDRRKALAAQS